MSLYEILLFVHVAAVVTWVGGGIMLHVIAERTVASNDPARVGALLADAEILGQRYFGPASGIALIAGIWLVIEGSWGWTEPFVIGGITGVALSTIIGFGMIQPAAIKAGRSLGATGTITAEVSTFLRKVRTFSRVDTVVLVVVLFLMTVKPGT
jgi:hypothetical protein